MGTRYQDQPVEHWAGPESLDPTPVWKQYLLVALLLVVGLVAVVAVSVTALAPYLARHRRSWPATGSCSPRALFQRSARSRS